jgi:hypothetical protein
VQVVHEVALAVAEYFPAEQSVHEEAPAIENFPAAHGVPDEVKSVHSSPALHGVHDDCAVVVV